MKHVILTFILLTTGFAHADWSGSMLIKSLKCSQKTNSLPVEKKTILDLTGEIDKGGNYSATAKKIINDTEITENASATIARIGTMSEPALAFELATKNLQDTSLNNYIQAVTKFDEVFKKVWAGPTAELLDHTMQFDANMTIENKMDYSLRQEFVECEVSFLSYGKYDEKADIYRPTNPPM